MDIDATETWINMIYIKDDKSETTMAVQFFYSTRRIKKTFQK